MSPQSLSSESPETIASLDALPQWVCPDRRDNRSKARDTGDAKILHEGDEPRVCAKFRSHDHHDGRGARRRSPRRPSVPGITRQRLMTQPRKLLAAMIAKTTPRMIGQS